MESQRFLVVVEDAEAARAALQWAVRNLIRGGDSITLLYVCPLTRSMKKRRSLRLKGFQLALAFKDLCNGIAEAKVEIIVAEGDQGAVVVSTVTSVGASTLVVGLHHKSFLFRAAIPSIMSATNINCRVLAIKQHSATRYGFLNTEFSQVETSRLRMIMEPRSPFLKFLPLSLATFWRNLKELQKKGAFTSLLHNISRPCTRDRQTIKSQQRKGIFIAHNWQGQNGRIREIIPGWTEMQGCMPKDPQSGSKPLDSSRLGSEILSCSS